MDSAFYLQKQTKVPLVQDYPNPFLATNLNMAAAGDTSDHQVTNQLLVDEEGGMARVRRKKDFTHMERVDGRMVNVLQGLELHTGVFSPAEQQRIVDCVHRLQEQGRRGLLRERTYSEPRKWMRGKGRATIQFGCCYNYATDRNGNPPGILRGEQVDPIPPMLRAMVRRLVAWRVLPATCVPDSCIVNVYDVDDCIPPHIDHRDFLRPFCTVSFLAECNILFGGNIKVIGPGEFAGATSIPLPVGSVLVLKGNGANVAKHCVPAVPAKRISITFRKMDHRKAPYNYMPEPDPPELLIAPAIHPLTSAATGAQKQPKQEIAQGPGAAAGQSTRIGAFSLSSDDFPTLGALPATALVASQGNRGRR